MEEVSYDVPLVPQPTDVSCWAASLTMVISHRDQASYSVEDVAAQAGLNTSDSYDWSSIKGAVQSWGLNEVWPASGTPEYWADQLASRGPIWVVETGNPYHAVVLVGISGDGSVDNSRVTVNNPWPPNAGEVQTLDFSTFESDFELGSGADTAMVTAQ